MTNWSQLIKVPDLVQRDALIHFLGEKGLEVYAPERDIITQLGSEPQLSLGGYSALFDGYEVFVRPADLKQAQDVLAEFQKIGVDTKQASRPVDNLRLFHISAIFTIVLPVVFHLIGAFRLWNAVTKGHFRWGFRTFMSLLIYIATLGTVIVFLRS